MSLSASKFLSVLPLEYGYCIGVLGLASIMNIYLTINVVQARKKYGVKYPALYAPETNKFKKEFDCVQRAHQNTLEGYPAVMLQMLICGLLYPVVAALCGGLWVIGRVVYGYGYANYGPNGRYAGVIIIHLGDLPLLGLVFKCAYDLLAS